MPNPNEGAGAVSVRAWPRGGWAIVIVGGIVCSAPAAGQADAEEPFTLDTALEGSLDEAGAGDRTWLDAFTDNLRLDFDFVSRLETTSRRGELAFFNAAGLDIHTVLSDDRGDFGTLLLQPYVVRRDNAYARPIEFDGDDSFVIELHDFYLNVTRWGRGRTNIKVGHFDVPFALEPLVDTHFTLHQFIPLHNAGFKKDWGVSLNGALPDFDYEVAATTGTGEDLTRRGRDPFLFSGRIGTPSDENFVIGLSAFYGEVIDEHGTHRIDENDPRGEFREEDEFVRRWRVGVDATQIVEQFTFRGELSSGEEFEQAVFNALLEVGWDTVEEDLGLYLQLLYLGQDGHLGWDEDVWTRLGLRWRLNPTVTFSAEWIHEFETFAENLGELHLNEDTYTIQLRLRF